MNILFTFGHDLTIGGHFKSGIAFAEQLINCGHTVFFTVLGGDEKLSKQIERIGASVERMNDCSSSNIRLIALSKSFSYFYKTYSDIIKRNKIDIVHAHDSRKFLPLFLATCNKRRAFVYSHAGGIFFDYNPPLKCEFFVFSPELLNAYKSLPKYRNREIKIISERISPVVYKPFIVEEDFGEKYHLPKDGTNLFFSMRLHSHKKPFIDSLLAFSNDLINTNVNANIIVAGDGNLREYLKKEADIIQIESHNRIKFYLIGSIYSEIEIAALINYSTVIIGTGRGIMEAMACEKPTIILGENKDYDLVKKENIAAVSYYNFSGRHFAFSEHNNANSIKDIIKVMTSIEEYKIMSQFSFEYFSNKLSSIIGVQKLLSIYNDSLLKKLSIIDGLKVLIKSIIE